jgi:hypothetical protein
MGDCCFRPPHIVHSQELKIELNYFRKEDLTLFIEIIFIESQIYFWGKFSAEDLSFAITTD